MYIILYYPPAVYFGAAILTLRLFKKVKITKKKFSYMLIVLTLVLVARAVVNDALNRAEG